MIIHTNAQDGYSLEQHQHGILVFHFEEITPATLDAWYAVQKPLLTRVPSREQPGLLMLTNTNGQDTVPFAQLTQRATDYTRQHRVLMPMRHAWVMPVSPVTKAARPMVRLLPADLDIGVRFFAPNRLQMAHAWLIAEHAQLLSRAM